MTDVISPAVRPGATVSTSDASYVEWGAALAGAALATALSFVLLTFGTAIGLSATSPWPNSGVSAKVIASVAVFWVIAQQIGSVMVGGYVAGRMRSRWHEAGHEAEFRDGLHGALVWAVGVIITAFLAFATVGWATQTATELAGKTTVSSSTAADTVLDTMLRPATTTAQAPATGAAAPTARARGANAPVGDETRAEMSRILASSVTNESLRSDNRTYLAQLVAQRTGLSQQEADKRVDEAVQATREAAEKARRAAILTGLVTAVGLILSLGAGWWAAMRGGHHRDHSIPARFTFEQRRRTTPS